MRYKQLKFYLIAVTYHGVFVSIFYYTVNPRISAGSQLNAGSPINAGSLINAG